MLTTISELRSFAQAEHKIDKRIGLVPTMGALHQGHMSLVALSQKRCDTTIVSIFVNPTQFGPNEDFGKYPRTLDADIRLLESAGVSAVFVPSAEEMYPRGFNVSVQIGGICERLEGEHRPGHFAGVATIVLKLFLASQADAAFFGQKDYQQLCVIRKMVSGLNVPIEIVRGDTVREPDGLAMSSRNRYLSADERRRALVLYQSLAEAERMIIEGRICSAGAIYQMLIDRIQSMGGITIDYVSVSDPETLEELTEITEKAVILLAVRIGSTRLIDNREITVCQ